MITIIHGSHRHGIHWEIVTILKEYLEARDNEVRIIDLSEMEFNACCGTQVCQEGDCIYRDDQLSAVFESTVLPTDVIYIVTPTYFNMPPAKLKSFIDRTNALLPILEESNRTVYFGAWVSGEADMESIQTNSKLLKESLLKDLEEALQVLGERERQIISSSFGIGCPAMTLEEIGENMDLTRERVRQIRSRALRTLSSPRIKRRLAQYLQ